MKNKQKILCAKGHKEVKAALCLLVVLLGFALNAQKPVKATYKNPQPAVAAKEGSKAKHVKRITPQIPQAAVNLYSQTPELRDSSMVQTMRMAMQEGLLPTPIEYVVQMFWMTSFVGSLLSALLAVPAVRLPARRSGL